MVKIIFRIFCVILVCISLSGCVYLKKEIVEINKAAIQSARIISGMKGAENIYLEENSSTFYATDCSGVVYKVENNTIINQMKIGSIALGISRGPDGYLYVLGSNEEWLNGQIFKIDKDLSNKKVLFGNYQGINGGIFDSKFNFYFASGKLNPFDSAGIIYKAVFDESGEMKKPEAYLTGLSSPNGLNMDFETGNIIFSETFKGIRSLDLKNKEISKIFGKSRIVEGFDDLCMDSNGNYWVADQPNGFIKMYRPGSDKVVYFRHKDFGIASSCRIRFDKGEEMLYISEIKRSKKSREYEGRGIIIIPVKSLFSSVP